MRAPASLQPALRAVRTPVLVPERGAPPEGLHQHQPAGGALWGRAVSGEGTKRRVQHRQPGAAATGGPRAPGTAPPAPASVAPLPHHPPPTLSSWHSCSSGPWVAGTGGLCRVPGAWLLGAWGLLGGRPGCPHSGWPRWVSRDTACSQQNSLVTIATGPARLFPGRPSPQRPGCWATPTAPVTARRCPGVQVPGRCGAGAPGRRL